MVSRVDDISDYYLFQNSSGHSEDELAWAFTDNKATNTSTSASFNFSDSLSFNTSSAKSKKEQEEADYKYALALSRGEVDDSEA